MQRRTVHLGLLVTSAAVVVGARSARAADQGVDPGTDPASLQPGQYIWAPERAPAGPVMILVSLTEQRAFVYRDGIEIGVTDVSTGRPGHDTPTGTFTILQKDKDHHSSLYNDASMPYTERLTWGGVALHAGGLPGYPSSHGCVHLALEFSRLLFGVTAIGTTVVIADATSAPAAVDHPAFLLPEAALPAATPAAKSTWRPDLSPSGPVALLVSGADAELDVLRNGVAIGRSEVTIAQPDQPLAAGVFQMQSAASDGELRWVAVGPDATRSLARLSIPKDVLAELTPLLAPGTTLTVTPWADTSATRTDPGFTVLAQAAPPSGN